ncbi:MAG TPA: GntR family transcriptional regulator [Pseudonocardiaceae bacterium]|nr:GntR family transcriptional regulator [Pseudonocardiaceae bacterium]
MTTAPAASGLTTAAVRAIAALGNVQSGRADQIADRLAEAIRLGLLAPGERLPAEAVLSDQLGVATLTLREALAILRDRGLVVTRRGRAGGSFVARPSSGALSRSGLASLTVRQLRELGDRRQAVLGTSAALAARRAARLEIAALRRRVDRLASATTPGERRRADSEFGIEVAAAAQAPRLTQGEANLRAELGDLVWVLLSDDEHAEAVATRQALVDAVADGQPDRARQLAEQHIAHETELLMQWRIDLYRSEGEHLASADRIWSALADDVERILAALRATAAEYQASVTGSADDYTLADLAALRPRIHATLAEFSDLAVGTGIVTAPGVVADAPYWLEWWWRQVDGTPEALRVNLDPSGPDFFDYTTEEWFDVPIRGRREHVAGPYVDYACTNQYTYTLSVPVYDGDRPLGIAAMDVLSDNVERRIMPALCAGPAPLALLNASGRVIAASRAEPAPGAQLARRRGRAVARSAALARLCDLTGWTLVTLPRATRQRPD